MYKWQSVRTGEVVKNFKEVIRVICGDLRKYHCINIIWKYRKEGF